jgi:hypothetical protein
MLKEVAVAARALYELHPEPTEVEGLYAWIRDSLATADTSIAKLCTP